MTLPDLNRFRAQPSDSLGAKKTKPKSRKRWFLKGPIPGAWLVRASAIRGHALHVALALWYLAGVHRSKTVVLTWEALSKFSVKRETGRRGLAALERAELVKVKRAPGCCPRVTVLEVTDP